MRQLYTAPTLIRSLEALEDKWVTSHDLGSLRVLGTVGEPINPRAWQWFFEACPMSVSPAGQQLPCLPAAWQLFCRQAMSTLNASREQVVGKKRCPIVDTWWQTETGSIMITALPGAFPLKPGCATLPFFGVAPVLLDDKGQELQV